MKHVNMHIKRPLSERKLYATYITYDTKRKNAYKLQLKHCILSD